MTRVSISEFTDPGCPFAFSAEPSRRRLDWLFGDALSWETVMVGLAETGEDYLARGITPEKQAHELRSLATEHGMPIDTAQRPRMGGTADACRAVVAARLHAPSAARPLLRELRVRTFAGQLLDEPGTIAGAATAAGLDPVELAGWVAGEDVRAAYAVDTARARDPLPAAMAMAHKLAEDDGGHRYTCPTYELTADGDAAGTVVAAGFQPLEVYEVLLANIAPGLERRATPEDVAEVLAWAGGPLASAEVAAVCELTIPQARERLARVATERAAGHDGYWSLPA